MCTEAGITHSRIDLHQMLPVPGKMKSKNNLALRKILAFVTHLSECLFSGRLSSLSFILIFEVTDI